MHPEGLVTYVTKIKEDIYLKYYCKLFAIKVYYGKIAPECKTETS